MNIYPGSRTDNQIGKAVWNGSIRALERDIHGGSFRVFISKSENAQLMKEPPIFQREKEGKWSCPAF